MVVVEIDVSPVLVSTVSEPSIRFSEGKKTDGLKTKKTLVCTQKHEYYVPVVDLSWVLCVTHVLNSTHDNQCCSQIQLIVMSLTQVRTCLVQRRSITWKWWWGWNWRWYQGKGESHKRQHSVLRESRILRPRSSGQIKYICPDSDEGGEKRGETVILSLKELGELVTRYDIKVDMVMWLSESSLLVWF